MFRVTVHDDPHRLTFQVEGRLAGPWVRELETCWQGTLAGHPTPVVRVDLAGVTHVDAAGKALLAELHRAGAELVASGVLMRAVVAEVTQATAPAPGGTGEGGGERGPGDEQPEPTGSRGCLTRSRLEAGTVKPSPTQGSPIPGNDGLPSG